MTDDPNKEAPSLDRGTDRITVTHGSYRLRFSGRTGKIREIENRERGEARRVSRPDDPPLEWTVGGTEQRAPPEATITYDGADRVGEGLSLSDCALTREGTTARFRTVADCDEWTVRSEYAIPASGVGVEWSFDLIYRGSADEVSLRSVGVPLWLPTPGGNGWVLDLPGGPLPPSTDLSELETGRIVEWGPRRIHAGLVGLDGDQQAPGTAVWAFSRQFPVGMSVDYERTGEDSGEATRQGVAVEYEFEAAARLSPGEGVTVSRLGLDRFARSWDGWLSSFQEWWSHVGLETPDTSPDWIEGAAIYECHVGSAMFRNGFEHEPYPTAVQLVDDVSRIASLGFDAIQLMPKHPFPSYSVLADDTDTETGELATWGSPSEIRRLIDVAHGHGVRVILDVVLHGVLDNTVLDQTLASIRERPGETPGAVGEFVRAHADDWRPHLPDRHPLLAEHPGWFVRTDDGDIAHRYTRAFDLANRDVQEFFLDRLERLVADAGVDGFRFDAPTWNAFPNWAGDTPYPAGCSPLGGVELFERARDRLRDLDRDVGISVEAAGPLFRTASDVNYNYDELWLFEAVFGADTTRMGTDLDRAVGATDLAVWFDRRQKALPDGSRTAHHVDSHDTFWWPAPGEKWFRDRYGIEQTTAVVTLAACLDGPFMLYAGGESGLDDHLERLLSVQLRFDELRRGDCTYWPERVEHCAVFTALRTLGNRRTLVAVNLSDTHVEATVDVSDVADGGRQTVFDPLNGELVSDSLPDTGELAVEFVPFEPRLLVFRRRI